MIYFSTHLFLNLFVCLFIFLENMRLHVSVFGLLHFLLLIISPWQVLQPYYRERTRGVSGMIHTFSFKGQGSLLRGPCRLPWTLPTALLKACGPGEANKWRQNIGKNWKYSNARKRSPPQLLPSVLHGACSIKETKQFTVLQKSIHTYKKDTHLHIV